MHINGVKVCCFINSVRLTTLVPLVSKCTTKFEFRKVKTKRLFVTCQRVCSVTKVQIKPSGGVCYSV